MKKIKQNDAFHFTAIGNYRTYFARNFAIFAWVNAQVDAANKTKNKERTEKRNGNISCFFFFFFFFFVLFYVILESE